MKRLRICAIVGLILAITETAPADTVYEALFTSSAPIGTAGFAPPFGYGGIFNGGPLSGGLDQVTNFGLRNAPDYTGWNANHTGVGHYDDPSRGWSFNNNDNNGGYTDAYSKTKMVDSGHTEFEWTFPNVDADPLGYLLTVIVDDLDDYVAKNGSAWASVPDEWKVYVNNSYVGTLYDYDDPYKPADEKSINTFSVGHVSGSVKIKINGTYFNLLHDDAYYGINYGKYASWGDTASAQHGIRLEGLKLQSIHANTPASSTMWFEGPLTDQGGGIYTGTINAIAGYYYVPGGPGTIWDPIDHRWETPDGRPAVGGFDVYGKEGATAYLDQNGDGDFDDPNEQTTIVHHDAYSEGGTWGQWWDPDISDYQNYHLELTATTWRVWGFLDRGSPYNETPLSGNMNWVSMIATETGSNWNPTWTWGEELIPLQSGKFTVNITDIGGGNYRVALTLVSVPQISTEPATDVGKTSATLNSLIGDDGGDICQCRFDYWSSDFFCYYWWFGAYTTGQTCSLFIEDLEPNTVYYFQAFARNSVGETKGNIQSFTTLPGCVGTVLLLTPNGGEELVAGSTYEITWQTTGTIQNVFIEYSANNGAGWTAIATVPNTGSYQWQIPQVNSQQCLVRINGAACPHGNDTSDGVFTIYQCTIPYDGNHDCVIDMLDFALWASYWLQCGNPFNPNCQP
jgi:hypothetical protein